MALLLLYSISIIQQYMQTIACNRPKVHKCANTESRAMLIVIYVKTARFLVETNLDEVVAVHHKNLE